MSLAIKILDALGQKCEENLGPLPDEFWISHATATYLVDLRDANDQDPGRDKTSSLRDLAVADYRFAKYEGMRHDGKSAEDVYREMMRDDMSRVSRVKYIRALVDLDFDDAMRCAREVES